MTSVLFVSLSVFAVQAVSAAEIHGQVLADGSPVEEATVHAEAGDSVYSAKTDENGNFSLTGLEIGLWTIHAEDTHESEPVTVEITDESRIVTLAEPLILEKCPIGMPGLVILPDGTPVPGAFVVSEPCPPSSGGVVDCPIREEIADENGRFCWQWGDDYYAAPPPGYDAYAESKKASESEKVSGKTVLVLRAKINGKIEGQLTLPDGTPVPGAYVWSESQSEHISAITDEDGLFSITEPMIHPDSGRRTLYAGPPAGGDYADYVFSEKITVKITENNPVVTQNLTLRHKTQVQVTGQVTLPDGTVVSGSRIFAESYDGDTGISYESSDVNGNFALSDLTEGIWTIYAESPSEEAYELYDTSESVTVEVTGNPITLTLPLKLKNVQGQVTLPDGTPVPNSRVSAIAVGPVWISHSTSTDASGEFVLKLGAGDWKINADQPGGDEYHNYTESETVTVEISEDTTVTLNLTLRNKQEVRGQVTLPDGTPVPDASVTMDGLSGEYIETDENGYFSKSLGPGIWTIYAEPSYGSDYSETYTVSEQATVEITGGDTISLDLTLRQIPIPKGEVRGQVTFPDGTPAPNASVMAGIYYERSFADADENGNFSLMLDEGKWDINASLWQYADSEKISVEITKNGVTTQNLALKTVEKHQIGGRVILADGTPVENAGVMYFLCYEACEMGMVFTDASGYFYAGASHGTWDIKISPPDGSDYHNYAFPEPVTLEITDPDSSITLEPFVFRPYIKFIQGVVKYGETVIPDLPVYLKHEESAEWTKAAITDENGEFYIKLAEGGNYQLKAEQLSDADWFIPEPHEVRFARDESSQTVSPSILMVSPDGYVTGRIVDPEGSPLTTDETPNSSVSIKACNNWDCRSWHPDTTGEFSLFLPLGTYRISVGLDSGVYPDYLGPLSLSANVSAETENLGDIRMLPRNSTIQGAIGNLEPDPWSQCDYGSIWIWQQPYGNILSSPIDDEGNHHIGLSSGTWLVKPPEIFWEWGYGPKGWTCIPSQLFTGSPQEVRLAEDEVRTADFEVEDVVGTIVVIAEDEAGNRLTSLNAWAYARRGDNPKPVFKTRVSDGQARLYVPGGAMYIGLTLSPNSGYSIVNTQPSDQDSDVPDWMVRLSGNWQDDYRKEVTIILKANDSVIQGGLQDAEGKTITGVPGKVFATPTHEGSSVQEDEIDVTDGAFEISVTEGTWDMSYQLDTEEYVSAPLTPIQVQVGSEETVTRNLSLSLFDQVIRGRVEDPDGNRMPNIEVGVQLPMSGDDGEGLHEAQIFTDSQGEFELSIPTSADKKRACTNACLGARVRACQPGDTNCVRRARVRCGCHKRSDGPEIVLILRQADIWLEGKVFDEDSGTPAEGAFVSAYSGDGQNVGGVTDSDGAYRLYVARADSAEGDTWVLSAAYKSLNVGIYYRSSRIRLSIPNAGDVVTGPDLTLKPAGTLPDADVAEFDTGEDWTHTLADGFRIQIPANAMPTEAEEVQIGIMARVTDLPDNAEDRNISYGYLIAGYEKESGKEIHNTFYKDALLTFRYTDEQLRQSGADESAIRPAYYSEASDAWQPAKSFTIDKVSNKVTVGIDRFGLWSLVATDIGMPPEPGDVNNDGSVNLHDVIPALQVCAQLPPSAVIRADADVNSDGKIGLEEVIFILRKIIDQP